MKNNKIKFLSLCVVSSFFLTTTYANDDNCTNKQDDAEIEYHYKACDSQLGWYVGGDIGYASTNINGSDLDLFYQQSGLTANSIRVEDSDIAFSLFGGYQFTTNWALEAGYLNLGDRSVTFTGEDTDKDSFYDNAEHVYPQSGSGLSVALVASLALSESLKISGKLGYFDWEGDYITTESGSFVGSDKIDGADIWFGGELNYRFDDNFQLYLSVQRFELERDKTTTFSIGARYYFGEDDSNHESVPPKIVASPPPPPLDSDKDGVIDERDDCPASDIDYQVGTSGCAVMVEQQFNFSLNVYFAHDSSIIPDEYDEEIQELASFIKKYNVKNLTVYGHTSAPGATGYNLKLSQKRAESVAVVLAKKFNIDGKIIEPIGKGESELFDKSNTKQAHKLNRRIELNVEERLLLPVKK